MSFVHLHVHSQFSLLDGMLRVEDMVEYAKASGGAIAVTDHGWLGAAARIAWMAREADVKPIIGMEAYVVDDARVKTAEMREWWHLILIAATEEGYRNLCRLTTLSHFEGFYYKPRIDRRMLEQYSAGLVVLSGCIGSEVPQLFLAGDEDGAIQRIAWYQKVFGNHYFIEVQDHAGTVEHVREPKNKGDEPIVIRERELNEWLVRQAGRHGIGLVATNDAHYLQRNDGEIHDSMLALQTGTWKGARDRLRFPGAADGQFEFYLKTEAEMRALNKAKWWQTACTNTAFIAERVQKGVLDFGTTKLPPFRIGRDPEFERWQRVQVKATAKR